MSNEGIEIKDPQAVLNALERAKADAKRFREEKEALEEKVTNLSKRIEDLESDEGSKKLKETLRDREIKAALKEQGVRNPDKLLRLMDLSALEVDDEGNVSKITESIESVKADFPEFFDPKRRAPKADTFARNPAEEKKSTTEMQVDAIFA